MIDEEEFYRRVHFHCRPKLKEVLCEVCHKPIDEEMMELEGEYEEDIYRPGDEIPVNLSEEEASERRREIEEAFAAARAEEP